MDDAAQYGYGSEDELAFNEDFNPPLLSSRQGSNSPTQHVQEAHPAAPGLGLDIGLKASDEFYGFEVKNPKGADLAKYEKYAKIAERERECLEEASMESRSTPTPPQDRLHLKPAHEFTPSIFTIDSIYETEIIGASESAIKVYEEYVNQKDNFVAKNNIPDNWDLLAM